MTGVELKLFINLDVCNAAEKPLLSNVIENIQMSKIKMFLIDSQPELCC